MAEEDPVEAIEKALGELGEQVEGGEDFERLAEIHLKQLEQDYQATLAADIHPKPIDSSDHSDSDLAEPPPDYQVCQSDSDDEEWGELQAAEPIEAQTEEPQEADKNAGMSGDQIKRIKEAMRSLDLPPPAWAVGLSDETFLRFVSERIT